MVVRLMMIIPMGSQYKLHKTIKPRIQTASPCCFVSSGRAVFWRSLASPDLVVPLNYAQVLQIPC